MARPIDSMEDRLGFRRLLESVAEHAVSPLGKENILALEPSDDPEIVAHLSGLLEELWALAGAQSTLPLRGLRDVRSALEAARPSGAMLEIDELRAVAALSQITESVSNFLGDHQEDCPLLSDEREDLVPCPEVHRAIDRSLTPSGDVADAASPRLGPLRKEKRRLESAIRGELDRLMGDSAVTSLLSDSFTTTRSGRHVIPLAAGNRGKVQGIVHDRSASGETLFIEPIAVVELTNDATEARLAEEAEVRRVLAQLTGLVREHLEDLEASLETLGHLDALAAVADWGLKHSLHLPTREEGSPLRLVGCHHPLLWLHQRETSVPLSLKLEPGDRSVVISGPNAGGKTTALKTLGLVQMMVQCGLPIPAEEKSNVPVPRGVHADIGDDQDVMAGLSTFTAHMAQIAQITRDAKEGDLVLLDELGTATDPQEGGALAVALLEALAARGCLVFATSHLALLKQWAHETDGAQNASMGFDPDAHRPTFQLTLGLPGASEALAVARNVGLDANILERAHTLVPEQEQRLSDLLSDLRREADELATLRADAEKLRDRMATAEREHRESADRHEKERKAFRRDLASERKRLLAEAKAEVERRIADLPSKEALLAARDEIAAGIAEAESEIASTETRSEPTGTFAVGDHVEIVDARETGTIVKLSNQGKTARVETSRGMTLKIPIDRLAPTAAPKEDTPRTAVAFQRKPDVSAELNLIGQRVEPALEALDRFLGEASSHGLDRVRVIHGHGTGALKRAVRDCVQAHPLVKRWKAAHFETGGEAVTEVEMR